MHSSFLPAPERAQSPDRGNCVSILFVSCVLGRDSYSAPQVGLCDFEGRKEPIRCLSACWLSCLMWREDVGAGLLRPQPRGIPVWRRHEPPDSLWDPWGLQFTLGLTLSGSTNSSQSHSGC